MTTFADMVGERIFGIVPAEARLPFSADADGVCFVLDNMAYLVFENPDDGYRSRAGPILSWSGGVYELGYDGYGFPVYVNEPVVCVHRTSGKDEWEDGADILEVRSKAAGDLIFEVGTANSDDYYPSFVNRWNPAGLAANTKRRVGTDAGDAS